jgi:type IV pilus assembly protein PilQ
MKKLTMALIVFIWAAGAGHAQDAQTILVVDQPEVAAAVAQESPEAVPEPGKETLGAMKNVTLDFKGADIHSVLKILAQKAGVNIVATADVMGTITIKLNEIYWEKALDTIVKTNGFDYEWLNDQVIMVSTLEKLSQQRKVRAETQENEPFDTQTFVINFSKASDVKGAVEKMIGPKGKISLDSRTNTLIVTDVKSNVIKIGEVVKRLDKVTPQVMIEAKIIETTLGNAEKLGIDWNMRIAASGSKRPSTFPFTNDLTGRGSKFFPHTLVPDHLDSVTTNTYDDAGNLISSTTTETLMNRLAKGFPDVGTDAFTFGTLDFSQFQVVLDMLQSRSDTKILSNAHITALNNQEAKILVGTVVPIPKYEFSKETGNMVISGYDDKEVGVSLVVTPNINEKDFITLDIRPSVDTVIGSTGPNGERPVIATRSAVTKVMIQDGKTLVMGGLISENKLKTKKGIPVLGKIPVLDLIFGSKSDQTTKTELLIFITPHVVREGQEQPIPASSDLEQLMKDNLEPVLPAKKAHKKSKK